MQDSVDFQRCQGQEATVVGQLAASEVVRFSGVGCLVFLQMSVFDVQLADVGLFWISSSVGWTKDFSR